MDCQGFLFFKDTTSKQRKTLLSHGSYFHFYNLMLSYLLNAIADFLTVSRGKCPVIPYGDKIVQQHFLQPLVLLKSGSTRILYKYTLPFLYSIYIHISSIPAVLPQFPPTIVLQKLNIISFPYNSCMINSEFLE